jgi:hypothetical protein
MKGLFLAFVIFSTVFATEGKACGSHSCGSDFTFSMSVNTYPSYGYGTPGIYPPYGSPYWGYNPGYGYGNGFYGYRPYFFGRGAMAFRRSARLQNRAFIAASNGNFARANNLQARSNAAYWRGVRRSTGFAVRPYWL